MGVAFLAVLVVVAVVVTVVLAAASPARATARATRAARRTRQALRFEAARRNRAVTKATLDGMAELRAAADRLP